nr:hypothetical protein Iba_chr03aCG0700 [Ipomoea batatas]
MVDIGVVLSATSGDTGSVKVGTRRISVASSGSPKKSDSSTEVEEKNGVSVHVEIQPVRKVSHWCKGNVIELVPAGLSCLAVDKQVGDRLRSLCAQRTMIRDIDSPCNQIVKFNLMIRSPSWKKFHRKFRGHNILEFLKHLHYLLRNFLENITFNLEHNSKEYHSSYSTAPSFNILGIAIAPPGK